MLAEREIQLTICLLHGHWHGHLIKNAAPKLLPLATTSQILLALVSGEGPEVIIPSSTDTGGQGYQEQAIKREGEQDR